MMPSNSISIPKKVSHSVQSSANLLSLYRAKVLDAHTNRRIFMVYEQYYNIIRQSLLNRGWLEKLPHHRYSELQRLPEEVLLKNAKPGNNYEAVAISKIIKNLPAFFVWQPQEQKYMYRDVFPYRSRIRWSDTMDFSTKRGLISCAEQQHWFRQEGVSGMLFPRVFRYGGNHEEHKAFIEDFRLTQCRSLIYYLSQHYDTPSNIVNNDNSNISSSILQFALCRVKHQLNDLENKILDNEPEKSQIADDEWCDFLKDSRKIIYDHHKIKCTFFELTDFVKTGKSLLSQIEKLRPDLKWDGYKNLWILKPGYDNRGSGIVVRNSLDDIMKWVEKNFQSRYIIQKYIEKPLLIYNTKFDIRFYMLVSVRETVVQIWLHKECYLRFSTQDYNTDDLREAVHVTNNCVQRKYKIQATRDSRLPKNLMWTVQQFKAYMKSQNMPDDTWENRVFAGIRDNLTAAVLASLDEANLVKNSFELYGCDFMLDQQYNPILIEINFTPEMNPTTEVTARICPLVMQDVIKVIVDLPLNSRASTGLFQLVYEINYTFKHDLYLKGDLVINGRSMKLHVPEFNSAQLPKNIDNGNNKKDRLRNIRHIKRNTPASVNVRKPKSRPSKALKVINRSTLASLFKRHAKS